MVDGGEPSPSPDWSLDCRDLEECESSRGFTPVKLDEEGDVKYEPSLIPAEIPPAVVVDPLKLYDCRLEGALPTTA